MKRIGLAALTAVLMSGAVAPVLAADVYQQGGSTKDEPGVFDAPRVVNWTGFYIGGRAGYGHSNHDLTLEQYQNGTPATEAVPAVPGVAAVPPSCSDGKVNDEGTGCKKEGAVFTAGSPAIPGVDAIPAVEAVAGITRELFNLNGLDSSGFTGGGQVGFDVQRGRFVGGIFGSYDFSNAETTISGHELPELALIEQGDSWSIGARGGVLVNPRTLLYVLAAYTQTEFTFAGIGHEGADKDVSFDGITAGAGVEFALTNNIFMGIEGTHTFYGKENIADSCDEDCGEPGRGGIRLSDEIGETKVMGTLKIKLNSGLPSFTD